MGKAKSTVKFFWCLLFVIPSLASAEPEPGWEFRVFRSPHFEIVYQSDQAKLAKRYALAAEQAYEMLFPIFKEAPYKTIIVLSDETDASNGLATFLPYPIIYVYPVLPGTLESNDDYGDWPLEMMVHEYTHILNMYSSHGIYVPLRWVFGSVVRPNGILPKWYLEGLAVNLESRLTDHGRLRATETAASARAWTLGGQTEKEMIANINEQDLPSWPYGSRPYLFGGWWWSEINKAKGYSIIETWNQNFSRRIPFFLNGPMREQTGHSASELWDNTRASVSQQAEKELSTINSSGPHSATRLVKEEGEQSLFAISPSGQRLVYWTSRKRDQGSQVRLKTRSSANEPFQELTSEKLFKTTGASRVRWINERQFVFDQVDIGRPNVSYRDLYLFNLDNREMVRLTHQMRAQEPSPSPKGDFVAFIQNDSGRNRLMVLDLKTKHSRLLVNSGLGQRVSGPEFIDDNRIVFAFRVRSGLETLQVYNLATRQISPFNADLKSAQNPRRTEIGILASDAGTNVRNVYVVGSPSKAVSNTRTEVETFDYDKLRKELIFSELTPQGRRLMSMPFAQHHPPKVETSKLPPAPVPTTKNVKLRSENFIPAYYMWPRYWIPMLYPIEGGLLVQGVTGVSDPIGRNMYSLFGSYDTITTKPSYGIDYANRSFPSEIGLGYGKSVRYLSAGDITLESQAAYGSLNNRWPFNNRNTNWSLGGVWIDTQGRTRTYRRAGPTAGFRYSRLQNPLNTWFGFHIDGQHEEFLANGNNLAYGRSRLHLAEGLFFGGGHRVFLHTRGAVSPDLPMGAVLDIGETTVGGNYLVNLSNSDYLMRGYPSGTFIGRKLLNANLEYIFPLVDAFGGLGTFPMFFSDLEMAIFADAVSVDGAAYDPTREAYFRTHLSQFFMGTGAELRLNSTVAYHVPITFILGAYYGTNSRYGGGFTPFLGIGMGELGALRDKTP